VGGLECETICGSRDGAGCLQSCQPQEIRKELALASTQRLFVLRVRLRILSPLKVLKYQLATRQRIDLFERRDKNMRLMVETLRKRVSNLVR
jgi:hypothetical protein